MNDQSSSEKTEEPTAKKLRDARKKGNVLQVKDIVSLATFTSVFYAIFFGGDLLLSIFLSFIDSSIISIGQIDENSIPIAIRNSLTIFASLSIALAILYIVTVVVVKVLEVGFIFSPEPIKLSFKKINPVEGFKRIYSKKSFVEFLKTVVKTIILTIAIVFTYLSYSKDLLTLYNCEKTCIFPVAGSVLYIYFIIIFFSFLFITIVDYLIQAKMFHDQMKMTKDEVKREYKESEGSPEIKGERKRVHREILNSESTKSPAKSSFVVTNPSHYAIAFLYDRESYHLPYVYMKGKDSSAFHIRQEAIAARIPIIENVKLARSVYASLDEGEFITSEYFKEFAAIVANLSRSGLLNY